MDNQVDDQDFQNNVPPENLPVDSVPEPIAPEPSMSDLPPIPPIQQVPTYAPPVPNFTLPPENIATSEVGEKRHSVLSVIVAVVAIIIIIVLAFLLYYYATKTFYVAPVVKTSVSNTPAQSTTSTTPTGPATNVITFATPSVLPTAQKSGSCWTNSISQPFRIDAFRCTVGNTIYDPCFKTSDSGLIFCQMNPTSTAPTASFVIKLTKPLPALTLPATMQDNWAWFLKLSDGTICSPFTGTRPLINGKAGYYGCRPPDKNHQINLIEDLTKGQVWTAQEQISEKQGTNWVETSTSQVNIDTVWQ